MNERLPAQIEVTAIVRQVQAEGGFATIMHRGDKERGAISLIVSERGRAAAVLERRMAADFRYHWTAVHGAEALGGGDWQAWVAEKSRIDPDCWLVELDVADAERFIAETTSAG